MKLKIGKRKVNVNITQVDNAKNIDLVMPMYNLIEYTDNYYIKHLELYGNTIEMKHF